MSLAKCFASHFTHDDSTGASPRVYIGRAGIDKEMTFRLQTDQVFLIKSILTSASAMAIVDEYPGTAPSRVFVSLPQKLKPTSLLLPARIRKRDRLVSRLERQSKDSLRYRFPR